MHALADNIFSHMDTSDNNKMKNKKVDGTIFFSNVNVMKGQ